MGKKIYIYIYTTVDYLCEKCKDIPKKCKKKKNIYLSINICVYNTYLVGEGGGHMEFRERAEESPRRLWFGVLGLW